MPFFFLRSPKRNQREEQSLIPIHDLPRNTSEGSEFLDDAIRMEDVYLTHTEESVAAGSPKILL